MNRWDEIRARARAVRAALGATDETDAPALLHAAREATHVPWAALPASDPALYGAQGVYNAECGYILVSDTLPPARQRFVAAHEYAHHWLGHGSALSANPDPEAGDRPDDGPDRVEGYSPFALAERGADVFALELLLPADALHRAYTSGQTPGQIAARVGLPERAVLRGLGRALLLPPPEITTATDDPSPLALDASQRAAAHAPHGPVFVEAGPGTGKTRALAGRVAHLLAGNTLPEHILALTFSDRAADELRGRIARVAPDAAPRLWVGTFHAFALDLLRRWGERVGLPPGFAVFDPADARLAFSPAVPSLALDHYGDRNDPTRHVIALQRAFSRAQDELCTPDEYAAHAASMDAGEPRDKAREVARAYAAYEQALHGRGVSDFGGLLVRAVALLRDHADVREWARRTHRHVLVDEYQDVNRASRELLRLLAGDGAGLWAVGDPRQAIYAWRGASRANVRNFAAHFPGATHLALARNYRSRPQVVAAVNALAPHVRDATTATDATDMPFVAWAAHRTDGARGADGTGGAVGIVALPDRDGEIAHIAAAIRALRASGVPYGEQAVLCRTHAGIRRAAAGLAAAGLPVTDAGSPFERPEAKDMLALVSLACEDDGRAVPRVAAFAAYGVPEADALALCAASHGRGVPFPAALALAADVPPGALSPAGRAGLCRLHRDLDGLCDGDAWSLLARYLFECRDYLAPLLADDTPEGWRRRGTLARLLDFAHAHGRQDAGGDPCASLLARVRDLARADEDHRHGQPTTEPGADTVRLLTVHASKGLEFAAVFLPGMQSGAFPHREMPDPCPPPPGLVAVTDGDRDGDEACAFFVAVSRARDVLTLTFTGEREPSPYLDHLGVAVPPAPAKHKRAKTPTGQPVAPVVAAASPVYDARTLDGYLRCPRQHQYDDMHGFGERVAPGPYGHYVRAVWRTLGALTSGEIVPEPETAHAHFLTAWEAVGLPPAHPSAASYREMGTRAVANAAAIVAAGGAAGISRLVPLPDGGAVRFRPHWVAAQSGETPPAVQWWHVGERRTAHKDADRLALYTAWTAVEVPGAAEVPKAVVQIAYLASGERDDAEPFGARKQANRLAKYAAAALALAAGEFPAAPAHGDHDCPHCPYFVVCPGAE